MAYNETKQRFMIGKADINSLTLSLNRQQEAQRNYITALQNYWLSYYKIRKLTLHDFETGISLANEFAPEHGFFVEPIILYDHRHLSLYRIGGDRFRAFIADQAISLPYAAEIKYQL